MEKKDLIIEKQEELIKAQSVLINFISIWGKFGEFLQGQPLSAKFISRQYVNIDVAKSELAALESSSSSRHQENDQSDFPEIDFKEQIANELTRDELIERLCEMHKSYTEMRKEWFEKVHMDDPDKSKRKESWRDFTMTDVESKQNDYDSINAVFPESKTTHRGTLEYIQPKQTAGFMQIRDLTDEEWMNIPKAEILQLYKNCYKMLMEYAQSQQPEISVTDEEIEKHAKEYLKEIYTPITKKEVRELLVIFGHWVRNK